MAEINVNNNLVLVSSVSHRYYFWCNSFHSHVLYMPLNKNSQQRTTNFKTVFNA